MISDFRGDRLRVARDYSGVRSTELAARVGISSSYLSRLMAEDRVLHAPSDPLAVAIANETGFLPDYFFGPELQAVEGDFLFRRQKTALVRDRVGTIAHGILFSEAVVALDEQLLRIRERLPACGLGLVPRKARPIDEIEEIAQECRARWNLGADAPIDNMVRVLEARAGAVVTRIEGLSPKIEAFSRSRGRSVVVMCSRKNSPSRDRWSCAHELGHLLLHHGESNCDGQVKAEADAFAGAFLLPRTPFGWSFPRSSLDWRRLIDVKRHWKVSLSAMLMRALDIGLIDNATRTRGFKALSAKGWSTAEPAEPLREEPEAFSAGLAALDRVGLPPRALARELGWTDETFERLTGVSVESQPPQPSNVIDMHARRRN